MAKDFPILELPESPRERGYYHGEQLRDLIAEHLKRWRAATEQETGEPWQKTRDIFLASTHFRPAIERHTPGLWEELTALAEAAGQRFEDLLIVNLVDELWWFLKQRKEACTTLARRCDDGIIRSGQNLDVTAWMEGLQVALRVPLAGGGRALVFTIAGVVGFNGINSAGVSLNCNTLLQLPPSDQGLPVAFLVRGVLQQKTLAEAARFLRSFTHASGQHYLIAGPEGWLGLECDATGVRPVASDGVFYTHTNHPKTRPDLASPSSRIRLEAAERARALKNPRDAFCDKPLHRDATSSADTIGYTLFSMWWENRPGGEVQVTAGPPTKEGYRRLPA